MGNSTLRLLEVIAAIGPRVVDDDLRAALVAHAGHVHVQSQEGLEAEVDRSAARERYTAVRAAYGLPTA